jgi:hypothetical protein
MTTTAKCSSLVVNGEHIAGQLSEFRENLANEGPEVLLDFFFVQTRGKCRTLQSVEAGTDDRTISVYQLKQCHSSSLNRKSVNAFSDERTSLIES